MLLDTSFWTMVCLAIAYSVAYGKAMPALVAAVGVLSWFMLYRLEQKDTIHMLEELEAHKVEEQEEQESTQRMETERKERTRPLRMEEQIQNYLSRPSIDESRYTEPITAREEFLKGMPLPHRDMYIKGSDKFPQFG